MLSEFGRRLRESSRKNTNRETTPRPYRNGGRIRGGVVSLGRMSRRWRQTDSSYARFQSIEWDQKGRYIRKICSSVRTVPVWRDNTPRFCRSTVATPRTIEPRHSLTLTPMCQHRRCHSGLASYVFRSTQWSIFLYWKNECLWIPSQQGNMTKDVIDVEKVDHELNTHSQ